MLSDAEQQRLAEIEAQLRNDDPVFVQHFDDGRARRPGWHRLTATLALVVAAAVACVGLVFGSVGTVVVALTALGAASGMWVAGRNRP
jgi:Flp pilus assembly protein TadB